MGPVELARNFVVVLTLAAAAAFAQPTPTHTGLQYGDGHFRQTLNVFIPPAPAAGPRPAVLWIHGGGWANGSNLSAAERAPLLLDRGIVLVGLNYRYSHEAVFPAQIHDVKGAVRWLRANAATYNIDPDRIGVWGGSAGGHLAALVGTSGGVAALEGTVGGNLDRSSSVQAAVSYAGHTDFFAVHPAYTGCMSDESRLLGQCLYLIQENRHEPEWSMWVSLAEQAGAVTHVSADDPPLHLVHGDADTRVLPVHSQILHTALVDAGITSRLTLIPGAGHNFGLGYDQLTVDLLARWLAHPTCTADWNNDGRINSVDISAFITTWLTSVGEGTPGGDFDDDGAVSSADIAAFIAAWLAQLGGC